MTRNKSILIQPDFSFVLHTLQHNLTIEYSNIHSLRVKYFNLYKLVTMKFILVVVAKYEICTNDKCTIVAILVFDLLNVLI